MPLAAVALTAAACGSSGTASYAARGTAAPSGGTSGTSAAIIKTPGTSLVTVLTDGKGITVYLFEKDTGTASSVAASDDHGRARRGKRRHGLAPGNDKRTDGTAQVTYAGHPLW